MRREEGLTRPRARGCRRDCAPSPASAAPNRSSFTNCFRFECVTFTATVPSDSAVVGAAVTYRRTEALSPGSAFSMSDADNIWKEDPGALQTEAT